MAAFFESVGSASPWLWLALGILLVALEILVPNFVIIWPGLAAIGMALLTWLAPGFSGQALVAMYAGLSILMLFGGRALMSRVEKDEPSTPLNARGKNMVGRRAKVLSADDSQGKVEIDGVQWPAIWDDMTPETGQNVTITEASGVTLRASVNKR